MSFHLSSVLPTSSAAAGRTNKERPVSCSMTTITLRWHSYMCLLFLVLVSTASTKADHAPTEYPSEIVLKAGLISGETFGPFQRDLLKRLEIFALQDNVTLSFSLKDVQTLYTSNLPLLSPDCHPHETVTINDIEYNCNDFDMIVGDFWPNPDRYTIVDFTPPWLQTSISAMKYTQKQKHPELDVTTLKEASRMRAGVCVMADSYTQTVIQTLYPVIPIVPCSGTDDKTSDGCDYKLKDEQCFLTVSDELVLRRHQADDPTLEMTGERIERQLLSWPVSRDLDSTVKFLLNKWMYAAISNQTTEELYFEYFDKKLCPIGTAGKDCELSCDPDHGVANAAGECVCESTRWTGADCSIEIPEDMNSIPTALKVIAYSMFAFNTLVIILMGTWLYCQRKTSQVRVSQPFFLVLVLLGCLISSATILAMVKQDDDFGDIADSGEYNPPHMACMAMPWLYSVGFSVTFGTLFVKIFRVYKLFATPTTNPSIIGSIMSAGGGGGGRRTNNSISTTSTAAGTGATSGGLVTIPETLFFIGIVLVVDVIILILWTVIDPLMWQRVAIREDQFGDPLESQGKCTSDTWRIFFGIIATLHFGLLAVACYMCYVARNIPTKYSEHKYVTITMISNLQIFIVGVPVLIIVGGDPAASFFVRSVIVWMNDLAVVTLIFGNLIYSVHFSPKHDGGNANTDKASLGRAIRHYMSKPATARNTHFASPQQRQRQQEEEEDFTDSQLEIQDPTPDAHEGVEAREGAQAPSSVRPYQISSLTTISSQSRKSTTRSVSFNENVTISEIPARDQNHKRRSRDDAESEEEETHISEERFASATVDGAPLKPRRTPHDAVLVQPARQPSANSCLYEEAVGLEPTETPVGGSKLISLTPQVTTPKRLSTTTTTTTTESSSLLMSPRNDFLVKPMRLPSEAEDPNNALENHSSAMHISGPQEEDGVDEELGTVNRSQQEQPHLLHGLIHGPPQLPSRRESVFEMLEDAETCEEYPKQQGKNQMEPSPDEGSCSPESCLNATGLSAIKGSPNPSEDSSTTSPSSDDGIIETA